MADNGARRGSRVEEGEGMREGEGGVGRLGRPLWRAPRHGREAGARGRDMRARSGMDATSRTSIVH